MPHFVAIIGRPNVGKSTLFNQLTRSRDALVADTPGMTRDRKVGIGRAGAVPYYVIDTGGLFDADSPVGRQVHEQSLRAAAEADRILLVVDAQTGPQRGDLALLAELKHWRGKTLLVVNKVDDRDPAIACVDFHALGCGMPVPITARQGTGIGELAALICANIPPGDVMPDEATMAGTRVAVIGRPNVGKSTLVNRMLGEERMITSDEPGTTRDSIAVPFERDGRRYTLIDTAGIRRRARISDTPEKFSVVAALAAMDMANVVIFVVDAREPVTDQDTGLLGLCLRSGRSLVIAINKWDGLEPGVRERVRDEVDRKLRFVDFAEVRYISALHGSGVGNLFAAINRAARSAFIEPSTGDVNLVLERAIEQHQPPLVNGRRIKLRYAHLGGVNPPTFIVHGSQVNAVPAAYRRYLEGCFRSAFKLIGTPVRIEFRQGDNPFAGRRNALTTRQVAKRRRLIAHVKGR